MFTGRTSTTTPKPSRTSTSAIEEELTVERDWRGSRLGCGDVAVTVIRYMYKKIKFLRSGQHRIRQVDLPPVSTRDRRHVARCRLWAPGKPSGLRGAALQKGCWDSRTSFGEVLVLFAMCDSHDVGTRDSAEFSNTGVAEAYALSLRPVSRRRGVRCIGYELESKRCWRVRCSLIHGCECGDGCPSCVGSPVSPYGRRRGGRQGPGRCPIRRRPRRRPWAP